MDMWNKLIQTLIEAENRESMFLAYALLKDRRSLYGFTNNIASSRSSCEKFNLPYPKRSLHDYSREYDKAFNKDAWFGDTGEREVKEAYKNRKT